MHDEDTLAFDQGRDYHNMMVRLIDRTHLHRFAGTGTPVSVADVLSLYTEMEGMRALVSRVACGYDDMAINATGVSIAGRLFSTWSALLLAAGGRPCHHRPDML